jgi:hypothetical protein
MAFDFPSGAGVGQIVNNGGIQYVWDGVKWVASINSTVTSPLNDVGRNLLHNGQFNVLQRGQGAWSANGAYLADRWVLITASDIFSVQINTTDDITRTGVNDESAKYAFYCTLTGNAAAGAYSVIAQPIENVRRLAGKTVTVSFWGACSAGQSMKIGVSFDQVFGTGGSPSASVAGIGQSVTTASTWTRYSMTFAIPTAIGKTVGTAGDDCTYMRIWFSSGSTNATRSGNVGVQSGVFYLWGVQLEIGTIATQLEKRDPQVELAQCQRFYQANGGVFVAAYNATGGVIGVTASFPVTMRASPSTVTFTSTGNSNVGTVIAGSLGASSATFYAPITATGSGQILGTYTATADL